MTIPALEGLIDGRSALVASRGTAALMAAAHGFGLAGHDILVPVNLCPIAVAGLIWAGVRPVFHDVDPDTGNARLEDIAAAWQPRCGAILAVHNFGMPVAIDAFAAFAAARGMRLIEDCCNAVGAVWNSRPVGIFGDAAIYSFGPGKIVDAGGGGAVTANDPAVIEAMAGWLETRPLADESERRADADMEAAVRALRSDRLSTPADLRRVYEGYRAFVAMRIGPSRIVAIADALAALPAGLERRRSMAARWRQRLKGGGARPVAASEGNAPWRFNVLVDTARRDTLVVALRCAGVPCSTWYPPIAAQFVGETAGAESYPGAEHFASRVVNLWVDETITPEAVDATADLILRVLERPAA
ncbi:DegT/DnrJ/EryC1/StrS family aminotransferase [Bradyrhizobium sp. 23]|uniref:DegT/DnrJ/EryC1/StrS family aminotransferase n=1 Tax=Bradyrhizobium sp. 23 TaxID=2782667 RepID=UPI001FF88A0E|nr:DegT/DnrJ/EryC1/StrS family aminotransferase [Bradyrhizobium sp. 23]MCK1313392.1 DegT/DnrJ/EryC1/StrS family aminotransferase [Bradyrhizobium sp. 23]